jgi:hydroxypyruvate isomerase
MLRWSVNLTMLFKEVPFVQRLQAAATAGFGAVEFMWPSGINLDTLAAARSASGVDVALFNVDSGDVAAGERGFPNDPARKDWWRSRMAAAIELAGRLGCLRLNVQAGNFVEGVSQAEMLDCLCENLTWALEQTPDLTLFLEPLNRIEHPRYILDSTAEALKVIEHLKLSRLKLQFDVYHTQRTEGNLVGLLQKHISHIGHIQIADSPGRHQPGTGEINWKYVLSQVEALNYDGYVGLEYNPIPDTLNSIKWLPLNQRKTCGAQELNFSSP